MAKQDINEIFQWLNRPIPWDPVPDWVFERLDDRIRTQLFLKDLEVQRVILSAQLDTLNTKIEVLTKTLEG